MVLFLCGKAVSMMLAWRQRSNSVVWESDGGISIAAWAQRHPKARRPLDAAQPLGWATSYSPLFVCSTFLPLIRHKDQALCIRGAASSCCILLHVSGPLLSHPLTAPDAFTRPPSRDFKSDWVSEMELSCFHWTTHTHTNEKIYCLQGYL